MVFLPFLKMRKLRLKEVKRLFQGHMVSERSSQKFKLQAVAEITVTLQDAFALEINGICTKPNILAPSDE